MVANNPTEGNLTVNANGREVKVRYPDARLTLYMECPHIAEFIGDDEAMDVVLHYVSSLQAGKSETFGIT